jgi:signal transduction histidine kinase
MEKRTKVLFERIMVVIVILSIIHFVEDFFFDTPAIWIMDLMVVVVAVVSYYLHKKEQVLAARIIAYVLITVILFYFAAGTHARNSIHWHFLSVIAITIIIFANNYKGLGIVLAFIISFLLLYLELNEYQLNWFPELGDPHRSSISVIINISSAVVILIYAILSMIEASNSHEIRMEQEIKTVQKLNKELDKFVYSASHDLKAPLSSLRGLLTLAKMEKDPTMSSIYFEKMGTTISQAENFIKNITEYSRNARVEKKIVEINFKSFVEELFQDLSFSSGHPPVKLHFSLHDEIIHTDINRLQTIIGNILSNGIKYSDRKKSESWIRIKSRKENQTWQIEIEDNGIGIEASHLPKLFDMFYRANEQSTGSGLGLYIVAESLQSLEGSIEVSSEIGQGTKFVIRIPETKLTQEVA